jgi:hypothetical protein
MCTEKPPRGKRSLPHESSGSDKENFSSASTGMLPKDRKRSASKPAVTDLKSPQLQRASRQNGPTNRDCSDDDFVDNCNASNRKRAKRIESASAIPVIDVDSYATGRASRREQAESWAFPYANNAKGNSNVSSHKSAISPIVIDDDHDSICNEFPHFV